VEARTSSDGKADAAAGADADGDASRESAVVLAMRH
jgi:hypothetical protein